MHNCNDAYEKYFSYFSGYIEGDINPEIRKEIDLVIADCPACRETLHRMAMVRENLANLNPVATAPDFDRRLHQAIQSAKHGRNLPDLHLPQMTNNWKFPATIAAVILGFTAWFGIFQETTPNAGNGSLQESSMSPSINPPQVERGPALPQSGKQLSEAQVDSVKDESKKKLKANTQLVNENK